jgi:U3 small nucleolar RNA-associated protein 22
VFYDRHGGSVVGLLWNPEKEQPRNLKAFLPYSTKPTEGEVSRCQKSSLCEIGTDYQAALVVVNKEAVLGEIARLGSGIVDRIEKRAR